MPKGNHSGLGFWGARHSFGGEDHPWKRHLAILPQTGIFYIYSKTEISNMALVSNPERSNMDYIMGFARPPAGRSPAAEHGSARSMLRARSEADRGAGGGASSSAARRAARSSCAARSAASKRRASGDSSDSYPLPSTMPLMSKACEPAES